MPRPIAPNQRFPLWLKADAERTPRPTFYFRAASAAVYLEAVDQVDVKGPIKVARAFLEERLVGWEHLVDGTGEVTGKAGAPIPFDPELKSKLIGAGGEPLACDARLLAHLVDIDELVELFWGFSLGREDKKKFE